MGRGTVGAVAAGGAVWLIVGRFGDSSITSISTDGGRRALIMEGFLI